MKKELVHYWRETGLIKDERLLKAFKELPREKFVLDGYEKDAYDDSPLPTLEGQTISQPSTIMIMLQALELKPDDVVLEIGTGSGYNAALIAKLTKKVYTTEIVPGLVQFARKNLKKTGIKNVEVIETDGSRGYKKKAPYNKIIVTAACPRIPEPLIKQLKEKGIIVAPVGETFNQKMVKAIKLKGELKEESLGYFMFVPLKGKYGY